MGEGVISQRSGSKSKKGKSDVSRHQTWIEISKGIFEHKNDVRINEQDPNKSTWTNIEESENPERDKRSQIVNESETVAKWVEMIDEIYC